MKFKLFTLTLAVIACMLFFAPAAAAQITPQAPMIPTLDIINIPAQTNCGNPTCAGPKTELHISGYDGSVWAYLVVIQAKAIAQDGQAYYKSFTFLVTRADIKSYDPNRPETVWTAPTLNVTDTPVGYAVFPLVMRDAPPLFQPAR